MASSNRHWPSLFKSKPCSSHHHHQWQHDMNHSPLLASGACQKPIYSSSGVAEERSPEPKPRWNPKPEQIRILEAIFNSGMVNPPRDEIRKIRAQLQEYGQVGDANVFYWFQNRKSRSKHKQRQLQSARSQARTTTAAAAAAAASTAHSAAAAIGTSIAGPTSSSSSSSGSAGSDKFLPLVSVGPAAMIEAPLSGPMAVSVNETAPFHGQAPQTEFLVEPFYLQGTHAFSFSSAIAGYPEPFGVSMGSPAAIWSELMLGQERGGKITNDGGVTEEPKAYNKLHNPNPNSNPSFVAGGLVPAASVGGGVAATSPAASVGFPAGPISETQAEAAAAGIGGVGGAARSIVFINEVAFEVVAGPLNIREAFGEEAILIHSSGHAVLTDQWGLTLHPLQHGASYYLV